MKSSNILKHLKHFYLLLALFSINSCEKLEFTPDPFLGETSVEVDEETGQVFATSFLDDFDPVLASGELQIIEHGHLWGLGANPTIPEQSLRNPFNDKSDLGPVSKDVAIDTFRFRSRILRLRGNTKYYVRPYIKLSNGAISYGSSVPFTTNFNTFIDMVFVEGGTRMLGDSLGFGTDDERPAESIFLDDFAISRYEVSRALYDIVMNTNKSGDCPMCPATSVSWIEAKLFVRELTKLFKGERVFDLPTEAQWEYAARGGQKETQRYVFSGSENIEEVGWHFGNSGPLGATRIREIGLLKGNDLGIHDMTGNAIEWCEDWWGREYYKKHRRKENPLNGDIGFGTKSKNFVDYEVSATIKYFNPEITLQVLEEIGFTVRDASRFFYLDGEVRTISANQRVEFYPKVCRSCSYQEPNDFNRFCRTSNRNPLHEINEQDVRVGIRFVEIIK